MHALDMKDGEARFAYNDRQDPWHALGIPMRGYRTPEDMLVAANADFQVVTRKVIVAGEDGLPQYDKDGNLVYVEDSRATVRIEKDGSIDGLATVGTRYVPTQNATVLERAMQIIGLGNEDGIEDADRMVVDTLGVLHGGRQFFFTIDLGEVTIETLDGVPDAIQQYLVGYSSHDGKVPDTFFNTGTRAVCQNTVNAGLRNAKAKYKTRHTQRNADKFDVEAARSALNFSVKWREEIQKVADSLLRISISDAQVDRIFAEMFPIDDDATDRQKEKNDETRSVIRGLWNGPTNAGGFGKNGWSAWNTFTEYFDHFRPGTIDERAMTSLNADSWVSKAKAQARTLVLAQAN